MSVYDNFADSPNQIKVEGQEITIKFERTGDATARISWNIPPPAHGCTSGTQAYDGIVITISDNPSNYISTSPKDGVYYNGDPTADRDIHSGDVIDSTAYVVAAIYHDTTTTFVDIDGIKPRTPYYVSGYAVDNVGRYHREGVHSYSLPTGIQSFKAEDLPAMHEIWLYAPVPVTTKTRSGLKPNVTYSLPIKLDEETHIFKINGSNALTYGQLIDEMNLRFMVEDANAYVGSLPPRTGDYHKDSTGVYSQWDGSKLQPVDVLSLTSDPTVPIDGAHWVDSGILKRYNSGNWDIVTPVITSSIAPTILDTNTFWYDGTTVRAWEDGVWCDYVTIITDRDPRLPPVLTNNSFWFSTSNNEAFKWNRTLQKWDDALLIFYDEDPNMLSNGTFWYDETAAQMKQLVGATWEIVAGVIKAKSNIDGSLPAKYVPAVMPGKYWFDTRLEKFFQRNLQNTDWDQIKFLSFPVDPRDRKSCDVWWDATSTVDSLFVWESVSSAWIPVEDFFRQDADPNSSPLLDPNTAWVDSNGTIQVITPTICKKINYINSPINPKNTQVGNVWLDSSGTYHSYQTNGEWSTIMNVIQWPSDPFVVSNGQFWGSTTDNKLFKWNVDHWDEQCLFLGDAIFPKNGAGWYNTVDKILLEWNGKAWNPTIPSIKVQLITRPVLDEYEKFLFSSKKTGCETKLEVLSNGNTLFGGLANTVMFGEPEEGGNEIDAGALYKQLGVGDDGSPDERRALHEDIRMIFGSPAVRVELTKQQLDQCIDNALLVLRKHSTYSYKKTMFFLTLKAYQQVYRLTNRCVGFNKIVGVRAIHRTKAGAFRTAYSQNDNFAYAALQQLYTLGTFDMLTFHLTSAYVEELETLFASRIMFEWLERKRELKIYQVPLSAERVLVEAYIERTEQELLTDRETAYWIKRWAVVEAKGMLAQTRGKFATLPGPNGSTTLNASDLQTQLEQERQQLFDEVQSKGMQDMTDIGMTAHFVIG